jgi:uncharacterized protein YjbJ (UPF0337 family)
MTDDRIAGTLRSFGGKVQEGVGKVTGDTKTEVKGVMDQAAGAVQDAYGKTVDAAMEGAQTVKEAAVEGRDAVRKFVEDNPHTATAIALGIWITGPKPKASTALWEKPKSKLRMSQMQLTLPLAKRPVHSKRQLATS